MFYNVVSLIFLKYNFKLSLKQHKYDYMNMGVLCLNHFDFQILIKYNNQNFIRTAPALEKNKITIVKHLFCIICKI